MVHVGVALLKPIAVGDSIDQATVPRGQAISGHLLLLSMEDSRDQLAIRQLTVVSLTAFTHHQVRELRHVTRRRGGRPPAMATTKGLGGVQ